VPLHSRAKTHAENRSWHAAATIFAKHSRHLAGANMTTSSADRATNPTILVVDDEPDIRELLSYNLEKEGFRVLTAQNGKEALQLAGSIPDLMILDVMMPELNGWDVCKQLKAAEDTAGIPLIFLTAKGSEIDEVVGLELGADDYVMKPVSMRKLVARIHAVLRRTEATHAHEKAPNVIDLDGLTIEADNYSVVIDGEEVHFPRKEFQTLLYLARHEGQVVRREQLLSAIWGDDVIVVDRTIDVHIRKIREKLGRYGDYIETVKGVGYRLRGESR
jgi:two-component system, OmpR family, alkaline phosphatase synthesis response regulator PhoP